MQLVSSPRQTARGLAAILTQAAQGVGYKNGPKSREAALKDPKKFSQKLKKMAKNGPAERHVIALKIIKNALKMTKNGQK